MDFVVVRVGTTGPDPIRDLPTEIGAIFIGDPAKLFIDDSARSYYSKCRPYNRRERATQMNPEMKNREGPEKNGVPWLDDQTVPPLRDVFLRFTTWANRFLYRRLAGSGVNSDFDFLRNVAKKYERDYVGPDLFRDIQYLGNWYRYNLKLRGMPEREPLSGKALTDAVFQYVGLPTEPEQRNALASAEMEAEAFVRLTGSTLLRKFEKYSLPDHLKDTALAANLLRGREVERKKALTPMTSRSY